jgi:uncharacterized protein (TIGR02453 family)
MLQPASLKFLRSLKKNNSKTWFDANRKSYDAAKEDFANFIQELIDRHAKSDPTIKDLSARSCLFRINRDIRFSKDKSPYKSNFGASINRGGRKSMNTAGYYFHLEPGKSFAGGGIYMPAPEELRKLRQEIDYNLDGFTKIVKSKKFKSVYGDLDHSAELTLSRVPKGYDPGNPAADYLKLKSYIAMIPLSDADLTSKDLVKKTIGAFGALQPLVEFVNQTLE